MCATTGSGQAVPLLAATEEAAPRLSIPLEPVDQVTITTLSTTSPTCSQPTPDRPGGRSSGTPCAGRHHEELAD